MAPAPKCEHNRDQRQCKECGGTGICVHNKRRNICRDCDGSAFCKHNKAKSRCRECGGSALCEHNKERYYCRICGGPGVCEHGRFRRYCKACGGSAICEHARIKRRCKQCRNPVQESGGPGGVKKEDGVTERGDRAGVMRGNGELRRFQAARKRGRKPPPSLSSSSSEEEVAEIRLEEEMEEVEGIRVWVQCETCNKWRRAAGEKIDEDKPFFCRMLLLTTCKTAEEDPEEDEKTISHARESAAASRGSASPAALWGSLELPVAGAPAELQRERSDGLAGLSCGADLASTQRKPKLKNGVWERKAKLENGIWEREAMREEGWSTAAKRSEEGGQTQRSKAPPGRRSLMSRIKARKPTPIRYTAALDAVALGVL